MLHSTETFIHQIREKALLDVPLHLGKFSISYMDAEVAKALVTDGSTTVLHNGNKRADISLDWI